MTVRRSDRGQPDRRDRRSCHRRDDAPLSPRRRQALGSPVAAAAEAATPSSSPTSRPQDR